ncbi:MAG: 30S ribosomal protein S1 [Bacteroidota bacterium]|nr:30S ribosomal protein S1 [Bacteroidota bacterium]
MTNNQEEKDLLNEQDAQVAENAPVTEVTEVPTSELVEETTETTKTSFANANQSLEDFDWDNMDNSNTFSNKNISKEVEDQYASTFNDIQEKEVIKGIVAGITDKDVVINLGFKSDGLIPLSEFRNSPDLKVGDEVEVIVENKEDKNGQIVISHKKALAEGAWGKIVAAYENQEIVNGYIKDRTKGGMIVELFTLDAFLPGSQLDVKPIKDYDIYVGTRMDLKVVKINEVYRNIVVSHKAIIESDLEAQKVEILGRLEKGQVLEGIVKNLTTFGVFVDLGGVDGLIHITDVSWGRINHPEEVLQLGEKINVVVLDYDEDKKRISLGMKQLTAHPWDTLPEEIVEGSEVLGKVVNLEDYGAFVEIFPGVEGLVHVSEMSWSTHLKSPSEYVKVGDEVKAKVLTIDREDRKLSLGLKQLNDDPWSNIEEKFPVGSKHSSIVRSLTNFGLFVELTEGIDGLVHISDLSWTRKFAHPAEFIKVGEALDVLVLGIDMENRRLSLGHKQLEEDPWDTFESIFIMGSVHQGVINTIDEKGALITMPYGVEAFAPKKYLALEDKGKIKPEDTLEFKVLEFDKGSRKIIVSHSDVWKNEGTMADLDASKEKAKKTEAKKAVKSSEKSTLADELDILQQLKNQMEEQDKVKQKVAIAEMDAKQAAKDKTDDADTSATDIESTPTEQATAETEVDETPTEQATAETEVVETTTEKATAETEVEETTTEETPTEQATAETEVEETPTEQATAETEVNETPTDEATAETEVEETTTEEAIAETDVEETTTPEATAETEVEETPTEETPTEEADTDKEEEKA